MLESIQKLAPWASGLPLFPKIAITIVVLLLGFTFLYLVWVPARQVAIYNQPEVKQAYERMSRVLSRLARLPDGTVTVDGNPVEDRLSEYYIHYISLSEYLKEHPGNIEGAYEAVWEHGGGSRVFTNDTEAFETVVAGFFHEWEMARGVR